MEGKTPYVAIQSTIDLDPLPIPGLIPGLIWRSRMVIRPFGSVSSLRTQWGRYRWLIH